MHLALPDFKSSPWQHADRNAVKLVSDLPASKHHCRLKLDKVAKNPWVMQKCGGQQYTFVDVMYCTLSACWGDVHISAVFMLLCASSCWRAAKCHAQKPLKLGEPALLMSGPCTQTCFNGPLLAAQAPFSQPPTNTFNVSSRHVSSLAHLQQKFGTFACCV